MCKEIALGAANVINSESRNNYARIRSIRNKAVHDDSVYSYQNATLKDIREDALEMQELFYKESILFVNQYMKAPVRKVESTNINKIPVGHNTHRSSNKNSTRDIINIIKFILWLCLIIFVASQMFGDSQMFGGKSKVQHYKDITNGVVEPTQEELENDPYIRNYKSFMETKEKVDAMHNR